MMKHIDQHKIISQVHKVWCMHGCHGCHCFSHFIRTFQS